MMPIRFSLKSTTDLANILNRQLRNTTVLALETGNIQGYVDVLPLPNLRIYRIKLNRKIALCADRSSEKRIFSIDLSPISHSDCIQAQGISLTQPALFGFNYNLKDMDLVLPASSSMCAIAVSDDFLLSQLMRFECIEALGILESFNVLSNSSISSDLVTVLGQCWSAPRPFLDSVIENELIVALIQCLVDTSELKVSRPASRQDRHNAALRFLKTTFLEPTKAFDVQELSNLLYQSRTSIFSGCKEKFGMSPIQVSRSVRLHQVRHALLDYEFSELHNLNGVVDTAEYFGFVGRSHFARHYKKEFMETPRQTLTLRRKNGRII